MKHLLIITVALSMMLTSCGNKEKSQEQQSLLAASRQELATAIEERDQLLSLVKEITTSMDQIKHLENIMTISGTQSFENPARRAQILSDIAAVKDTLQGRREKLAELESRLQKSSLYTDELKGTIEALRRQIDTQTKDIEELRRQLSEADEKISTLSNKVDSLNTTVETVSQNLSEAEATSLRLENELNTCYYVVAPKLQLKEHKIIETGFLKKSKLMKGDFDKGFFIIGDKRNLKTIDLDSNKAKVFTNHPADSYEITEKDKQKTLTILDAERFWSLTNYLVIQID